MRTVFLQRIIITLFLILNLSTDILLAQNLASSNKEHFPEFSWDHVPLYVHIRKNTEFTAEEIEYLATFPLITFEKSTGNKDFGSTEKGTLKAARAVKELNPNTKILYYRNVIVHYGGYDASSQLADIPDAFLIGNNGNKKLIRNRLEAYDLSNKALRNWWISAAQSVCSDPAIDGVFLDGVVKVLEPSFLKSEIGEKKKAELLDGYVTMVKDTRQALGSDKLMIANILRARFPDCGLSYIREIDGSYIEGFEGAVGGMSKKDYVAKGISAFQKAAQEGAIIAFTCGLGKNHQDADETFGDQIINEEQKKYDAKSRFNYQLAIFLICAEKYSYFDLKDSYDAKTSTSWMTHPEAYKRPLGPPKGPAVRNGYTYTREFAHASVWLDIENEKARIEWK